MSTTLAPPRTTCPYPLLVGSTWRHTCKARFWQPIPTSRLVLDALHRPIGGAR